MELSTQTASSSSSCLALAESPPRWEFDVFLSFRGEDTRWGFISHLYHQLQFWQLEIKTFKDDQELEIGADISTELFRAIKHSHLAIVVLSPNYASSSWCLEELSTIMESMGAGDMRILPVFHNVVPSDVRHQRQSFAAAFDKHEEKYGPEKVKRWRATLKKVADFSGCDSKNYRSERELIEVIVERVWEKVLPTITLLDHTEKLVGINFALSKMGLLLAPEEKEVRFIGIWGMGGVGKTTLAKLVFKRISHHFEVAEFLVGGTTVDLQKLILSSILKENVSQVWDEYKGTSFIRKFLSNKKVLLVVDNVDHCDYLKPLAEHKSWFGEGSRIIVTTRDKRVLVQNDIEISFQLEGLSDCNALELFSQNAFKTYHPEEGFSELSKCFVDYAEGLPLALKVWGGFLYRRNLEEWNSALESLKRIPNLTIFQKLKLSYDALDDWHKNILLDIAFFHMGWKKERVIEHLKYYGFDVLIVINVLIEKSLLTTDMHNIGMHGLVQEMAWEIVRQECPEEPGRRTRLCHRNDIFNVFTRNTGTDAIKGIRLCSPRFEETDSSWNHEGFSKMSKLMFLEFNNLIISSGPKVLPNSLRILRWNRYPSKSLPACFRPNVLSELNMESSNLVQLWDGKQDLPHLKYMDLMFSRNLRTTPDFTGIPNLEKLDLTCCESLVKVHPSIAFSKKLKQLWLAGCKSLRSFPSKIEMDSLEFLSLDMCSKVKCPEFGEGMKNLSFLNLSGTATEELPSSIGHLVGLEYLNLDDCKSLHSPLRQNIGGGSSSMKRKLDMGFIRAYCLALPSPWSLMSLILSGCNLGQGVIPDDIGYCLPSLEELGLDGSSSSMKGKLDMGFIRALFGRKSREPLCLALPSPWVLPSTLTSLFLSGCNLGQGVIPDDIGYCLPSLVQLELSGNNFVSLPASIKCLSKLHYLTLSRCKRLQQLPDLPLNKSLSVWADDCDSLKKLSEPSQQGGCTNLEWFHLRTTNCFGLVDDEGLNNGILSMLRRLAAQGIFHSIKSLEIVSPGSKISEWFDIQSEGDSLTVELPPPDRGSEWTGIVFCVLLAPLEESRHLRIECSSPGIDTESVVVWSAWRMRGDHLWVFFMPRPRIQDTTSGHMDFSFDADIETIRCPKYVKRCGARLLYEQDLVNMLKRSRDKEEGPSGSSINKSLLKRHKP